MISESLWDDMLGHVRVNHPSVSRAWFRSLVPTSLAGGTLEIDTHNAAQHQYLTQHCALAFSEAAQAATGRLIAVRFLPPKPGAPEPPPSFEQEEHTIPLNKDYTFDNFVVGPCNRLAHAACVAVSEAPGTAYNPLFVHGSAGLGKTHLLQAVCQRVVDQHSDARTVLLSCETFTNQFIEAIERGAMHQFRYRYRHVDVLVIDDIQFLAARDGTQEEFFHTFNTLFQAHKQIILSADAPPKDIAGIEDRLISRFNWGLVARIDRPCLETRIAIVQKKAKLRCIDMPEEAACYIASTIESNIRELEGAITKVNAYAQEFGGRIDLDLARRALGEEVAFHQAEISVPQILDAVVKHFNVRMSDLQGKRRSKSIAFARQVCMYLARELTRLSLEEIGNCLGGRDHTTVLHAAKHIRQRRTEDANLDRTLVKLTEGLRQR